ncbi:CubicO group peptidase, beta-lactamase class C family [Parapedobacter composti]|uniref:CubicO group peptidase, beta-lactamase class C family n=1 Tax=Parapedobacter composti TaxID=623281 RepID=A0A1I1JA77_9SPHI|nr:serine hydrolase domain-containing protein [Parapedobacter composti]SFC45265.1 CubicO group peptidase, beta-lactamase class C family [Parapedobacter composti]
MNRTFYSIGIALAIALQTICMAILAQPLATDTVAKLDAYFAHHNTRTPGASVTISRRGEIIYHRHFGMADLEHGIPVTDSTRFEAGSVSKQFTATAVLLLAHEGKVSLDDEVRKYIPELPDYGQPITIRHLLNHTSGLKDWGSIAAIGGWPRGSRVYTNDIALDYIVRQPDLNHPPGEEYLYSNSNYTLLTILLERVSGQSLAAFTEERFFKPLGMTQTLWRTDFREIVPGRAIGYQQGSGAYLMDMPFENTYGHAALLTTTRDLDRWNTSWGRAHFDESLLALRTARGILNNGDTIDYAGGVRIGDQGTKRVVHHSGATAGYRAWLSYFPGEDLSIVYLSNDAGAKTTATGRGLAAVFVGDDTSDGATTAAQSDGQDDQPSYQPDPDLLKDFSGQYTSEAADGRLTINMAGDRLQATKFPHTRKHTLIPTGPDHFIGRGLGSIRFARDDNGHVTGLYVTVDRARNVWFKKVY